MRIQRNIFKILKRVLKYLDKLTKIILSPNLSIKFHRCDQICGNFFSQSRQNFGNKIF